MIRVREKVAWVVVAVLGMLVVAALAGVVRSGPLDPPGTPGPTMKTLDQVEPRTPISSLPYTIAQPGSYYLTGNLAMASASDGITITAPNVTLDLSGFTIDGANLGLSGVRVNPAGSPYPGVIVRNGTATHWTQWGFDLQFVSSAEAEDIQAHHNTNGINVDAGSLRRCTANFDSGTGVRAFFSSVSECSAEVDGTGFNLFQTSLSNCQAGENTSAGIIVERGLVESCSANANHYGIVAQGPGEVHHNNVYGSASDGIRVVSGASGGGGSVVSDNDITYSAISAQGSGIYVGYNDNRILHNHVAGTYGAGIYVDGSYNTIDGNSVLENQYIGIDVFGTKNTVILNSALGNVLNGVVTNYSIGATNNAAPVAASASATNPLSNTQ